MDDGFVSYRFIAEGESGACISCTLFAEGDPGNRVTVSALCQSALSLALDLERLPHPVSKGGLLTPATAFGAVLRHRLEKRGFSWSDGKVMDK